jgi:hypothetical protein
MLASADPAAGRECAGQKQEARPQFLAADGTADADAQMLVWRAAYRESV